MTRECTLKEAYIIKALDEFQPDWREGADVRWETKDKIRQRIAEKYGDIFDPHDSACITYRSIEETVRRIRNKLGVIAKSTRRTVLNRTDVTHTRDVDTQESKSNCQPIRVSKTLDSPEPTADIQPQSPQALPESQQPEPEEPEECPKGNRDCDNCPHWRIDEGGCCYDWDTKCSYTPKRPLKETLTICPCGCGYGYDEFNEKWYSPQEMEGKYV